MFDTKKQIEYWTRGAASDIDTAGILIKNKKYLHGLFFCHLTIEKIIKAHVTKAINQIPPKSHNLFRLLEITDIEVSDENAEFLGILMKYQLEGRYPDYNPEIPDTKKVNEYLKKTKEILLWLKNLL
jgi:HEPN domain-containing protein